MGLFIIKIISETWEEYSYLLKLVDLCSGSAGDFFNPRIINQIGPKVIGITRIKC